MIESYVVDDVTSNKASFRGRPVHQLKEFMRLYSPDSVEVFVAISYHEQNTWRENYFNIFKENGFALTSYVSDNAYVAKDVILGSNCLVLEGTVI